ncbi:MAG: glycosyltransferase [Verrucomicrobiota bacterium]
MKLLHSIRTVNPARGGPIEVVRQFGLEHQRAGHDVRVASLDHPLDAWVRAFPFPVIAYGPAHFNFGYRADFVSRLIQDAREMDAVIIHGLWQYSGLGVWRAFRHRHPPYCIFPHGMLDPWFKRQYPLKHFKQMVYWRLAERRILRDARAVLFTCEEERRLAQNTFQPYHCTERITHLGVEPPPANAESARQAFLNHFESLKGSRLLLFLGRLHPKKGVDLLLRAFAKIAILNANWKLVMAGPDQLGQQAEWKQLASQLGLADRIVWTGLLQGELKWGAYYAAEVFTLPSHQENFGLAVVEAMACGVPVLISTAVNIHREITADNAGFAEPDQQDGIDRLLRRWLELPMAEQQRMRGNARRCFGQRFEVTRAAEQFISVLADLGIGK